MPSPGRPKVAHVAAFGHQADLGGQPNSPAFSGAEATLTASAISTDGTLRVGRSSMLKMAILGGLQLATTAFSEGDTGLRAALHTPEEPPSQRARSQRLWCPL